LDKNQEVNHIILEEDITKGERVKSYKIQARINGKWKTVCQGQSVGNKRIQEFEEVSCKRLRLFIDEARAEPQVSSFAVFNVK
jgi:alpha-L-fucosidase